MNIGKFIRNERKKRDLTQQDIASQSGLSRPTISSIERGAINDVGFKKIERVLRFLGFEISVQKTIRPTLDDLKDKNIYFGEDDG